MDSQFHSNDPNLDEARLEVEFRQILFIIKNSILYVNSSYNLSFYRAWLEKLNSPCTDKYLRNTYLIRLARQIQGNYLSYPFNRNPQGPLNTLDDRYSDIDVNMDTTLKYNDQKFPQRVFQVTPVTCIPNKLPLESNIEELSSNDGIVKDDQKIIQERQPVLKNDFSPESFEKKLTKIKKRKFKTSNVKCNETSHCKDNPKEDCPQHIEEPVNDKRKGLIGNIQEDSSWYDLTDTSLTSIILNPLGSGDAVGRAKLHMFKDDTKKFETNILEASDTKPKQSMIYSEEKSKIQEQEQNEVKHVLKDTHFISTDWKKTIESLQIRLTETLTQNNELKMTIQNLSAQIHTETRKREESECYQEELREAHMKEIQTLEKIREENLMKLERSFQLKFEEAQKNFNEKIQDLTKSYETKMTDLKKDNENIRTEKEREILKLSEIIQTQCMRISEEIKALRNQMETFSCKNTNSDEKIYNLQRCVSKMDKLFHKSEKEYLKQIEKLKQEIAKRDKLTQIQLKSQKAELIAKTSAEKQRQFDELVNNLEVKYIKMLEYHEKEVLENKKEDDDRIEYLKHLLDKYDIPYNIT